jgi:triacylglycerol esterase/lipase EstA (alpha/beta hydrolase family)
MQLAADVDKLLNKKIPIATLFQSPTIASFAARLTNHAWAPDWNSLVPLQPQGSQPPLFIVHGYGGDVYEQLNLARMLKNQNRPVYGLQAIGLDGETPRHSSLEEMAKHYAREIISFDPNGPYRIAGYSVGGWIAF